MLFFGKENGKSSFSFIVLLRDEKEQKKLFLFSYFCVTKSTKSHQRERSPLFANSSRVHELVA